MSSTSSAIDSCKRSATDDMSEAHAAKRAKREEEVINTEEATSSNNRLRRLREEDVDPVSPLVKKAKMQEESFFPSNICNKRREAYSLNACLKVVEIDDSISESQANAPMNSLKRGRENEDYNFAPQSKKARGLISKQGRGPHHRSSQAKPRRRYLHDLPPEIRTSIWEHSVDGEWDGRSPSIIRALRCDKKLYREAIEVFYKSDNTFHLNQRNGWSFCQMSQAALESIRKIKIEIK